MTMQRHEKTRDTIWGGDTKRSKLKDKKEDFRSIGPCLWTFGLIMGADHWHKAFWILIKLLIYPIMNHQRDYTIDRTFYTWCWLQGFWACGPPPNGMAWINSEAWENCSFGFIYLFYAVAVQLENNFDSFFCTHLGFRSRLTFNTGHQLNTSGHITVLPDQILQQTVD
jgi:hypothetical protein